MLHDFVNTSWLNVLEKTNVNEAYNTFYDLFQKSRDKHCPIKQTLGKRQDKSWFTDALKNACRKKNTLYKEFITNPNIENEQRYKKYKNKLTKFLRKSESDYYKKKHREPK